MIVPHCRGLNNFFFFSNRNYQLSGREPWDQGTVEYFIEVHFNMNLYEKPLSFQHTSSPAERTFSALKYINDRIEAQHRSATFIHTKNHR